jgi:hypothetical protein
LPGSSYLVQTERTIAQSQAVVVVISQHTLQAPLQITPEIVRAHEGGKPMIPVLRDLTHEALQQQPEWRQAMAAKANGCAPCTIAVDTPVQRTYTGARPARCTAEARRHGGVCAGPLPAATLF